MVSLFCRILARFIKRELEKLLEAVYAEGSIKSGGSGFFCEVLVVSFWKKKDEQPSDIPSTALQSTSSGVVAAGATQLSKPASVGQAVANPTPTSAPQPREGLSFDDELQERFGKIRSALGPGTVIQGKLSFDTPVRIDGKLSGEVFSSKALIVGTSGSVEAQIEASVLIVQGIVKGNVVASERIEIAKGGRLEGDICSPVLVVEEGASFSGGCSMGARAAGTGRGKQEPEQKGSQKQVSVPVVAVADGLKVKETGAKEGASPKEVSAVH